MNQTKARFSALLPLGAFLAIYLGTGAYYQSQGVDFAFYQLKAPVAILPAILLALLLAKGSLNARIEHFLKGMGDNNILLMCLVFLLSGAFAAITKSIGGVDATVNLGLSALPASLILPGLFVIAAFISTAMGTSMGTIAAVAPIAVGVTEASDLSITLTLGAVVGGAMFGDNLSIISDTTIAATRTQGCNMKDKFKTNLLIAAPAAVLTLIALGFLGESAQVNLPESSNAFLALPYIAVLALAVSGLNVLAVLSLGVLISGVIGFIQVDTYAISTFASDIYNGFTGMQEILLLSLLIGGLTGIMKSEGGLEALLKAVNAVSNRIGEKSRAAAEFSVAALVSVANLFIANNTISILVAGSSAKEITDQKGLDPKRTASILDIFSCIIQGLIPYGAQILLASSFAKVSPITLVGEIYYCWALAIFAVIAIVTGYPAIKSSRAPAETATAH